MKRTLVSITFSAFVAILFFASCKKDNSATIAQPSATVTSSKSTMAVGDTVTVAVSNINKDTSSLVSVNWVISPKTHCALIKTMKDSLRISFDSAGTYTITAIVSDSLTHGQIVTGNSVTITVTPQPIIAIQTGDVLNLKPILSARDTTGICLMASTTMNYADSNYVFSYNSNFTINNYAINIGGVVYPAGAVHKGIKGIVTTSFYLGDPKAGTYPISINWLGKAYTGSLSVTGTNYTFTWDNTGGVKIFPLTVRR